MINFILNNRAVSTELPPGITVLDFVRNQNRLTGTKIGCREGDCGACTVLVGDLVDGKIRYITMTSCLMPLGNALGKHIVTIEGLNLKELTPIQHAFIKENGTQCGFCTPGFIVSLIGYCLGKKELTYDNAINAIAGNICRCTGYKSIERAVKKIVAALEPINRDNPLDWLIENKFLPAYLKDIPARLEKIAPSQSSKSPAGEGIIVGGGTDLLIQEPENVAEAASLNLIYGAPDLKGVRCEDGKCYIGSTTTVEELCASEELAKIIPNIKDYIKLIASTPIRHMATVGGNIANGSPIGDLSILFLALDAVLVLKNNGEKRELPLNQFFTGYKKVNKEKNELIETIYFEIPEGKYHINFEKISKRIHLDMATVNSALRVTVENDGTITKAAFSVGGLGSTVKYMEKTSEFLVGKKMDDGMFAEVNHVAQGEITPRSRAEYKRLLVRQMLFAHLLKFFPENLSREAIQ
ncbi:FAD binding domain-containing protein [Candidatus Riflebacteria bacterium]